MTVCYTKHNKYTDIIHNKALTSITRCKAIIVPLGRVEFQFDPNKVTNPTHYLHINIEERPSHEPPPSASRENTCTYYLRNIYMNFLTPHPQIPGITSVDHDFSNRITVRTCLHARAKKTYI